MAYRMASDGNWTEVANSYGVYVEGSQIAFIEFLKKE